MIDPSTICAISTPPGSGAVSLIRISGSEALALAEKIFQPAISSRNISQQKANTVHFGSIYNPEGTLIDDVLLTLFRAPRSFTGEDTVEITCHGSPYIQQSILNALLEQGARLARPGEFTQRAFLNGKMDLSQAEAIADLIASSSEAAHAMAIRQMKGGISDEIRKLRERLLQFTSLVELELDFGEEDVAFADRESLLQLIDNIIHLISRLTHSFRYGNALKKGIPVAIVGDTNVGKSTLLNLLLQEERAIVSDIAGTTRDAIEDLMVLEGIPFRFIDTAGIRETTDTIETIGIERTFRKIEQAEIILLILDPTLSFNDTVKFLTRLSGHLHHKYVAFVINKTDIAPIDALNELLALSESSGYPALPVSARKEHNIEALTRFLLQSAHDLKGEGTDIILTNLRHYEAFMKAGEALQRAKEGLAAGVSGEFLAQDIRECLHYLGEITGEISTDEVLGNIFKNFCIGK